jgi:hypothetical protein
MPPAQNPTWSGSFSGQIEHRLFSHITMNWRGRPLTSHEVVVNLIAATTTRTGLRVHAELDTGSYPTGIKISDAQMAALPVTRHTFHGDWNYTLHPTHTDQDTKATATPDPITTDFESLSHPSLTGMSRQDLHTLTTALQALHHTRIETAPRAHRLDGQPHAPRHGRPAHLAITHRVLVTVLHLRLSLSHDTLAHLFRCSRSTIRRVITETREYLNDNGTTIEPDPHPTPLTELLTKIKTTDK